MIVKCPSCKARYRIKRTMKPGQRFRVCCPVCQVDFVVSEMSESGQQVRVLIAHSNDELCQAILDILQSVQYEGVIAKSSQDVLRTLDQLKPDVAIIDVALDGLYAFELVDIIKRRPDMDQVKIILLSSIYNKTAYKRSPSSLYGADDYIEKHHLPDSLVSKINDLLNRTGHRSTSVQTSPQAAEQQHTKDKPSRSEPSSVGSLLERIQSAEQHQFARPDETDLQSAEKLARLIVSDIFLYHQERFDEGILQGSWSDLLALEVKEAKRLFNQRFPDLEIQKSKILERAFLDLLDKRQRELNVSK